MSQGNTPFTEVSTLGEFKLIEHLTASFSPMQDSSKKAIGDDAAVLDFNGQKTVISVDTMTEEVHFDLHYTPLKHLGYKSIVMAISDILAMNVMPSQVLVSVAVSARYSVEMLEKLFDGMRAACETYEVDLVGGDTTSSNAGLMINVTAIGSEKEADLIAYRSGAKPKQVVAVTGVLGGAYLGLQILEREKRVFLANPDIQPDLSGHDYILEQQLKPDLPIEVVRHLRAKKIVPAAMMDISDGLASELMHIARASKVGMKIFEKQIPLHPKAVETARNLHLDPTVCALNGGEDYELLCVFPVEVFEKLEEKLGLYAIGYTTPPEEGVKLTTNSGNTHDIEAQGWQHFKPADS